jgi:dolichol-phosphate mannosyltransferase
MSISLSILIPARDEEENVKIISNEIITKINVKKYEIIFINDFSKDNTEKELKQLKLLNGKVVYYNNLKKGLGGAIDLGIKKSRGEYVCIMMSDSSDSVDDLNAYYKVITSHDIDAVFGSRFMKGSKIVNYPILKMIFNRAGNLLAKILLRTDLNDFTNGFKIYKKKCLINLYPLFSKSFNIFFEIPLKFIIRGFKFKVIPISYHNRTVGEAKFKIYELAFKYFFTLLYIFFENFCRKKKILLT